MLIQHLLKSAAADTNSNVGNPRIYVHGVTEMIQFAQFYQLTFPNTLKSNVRPTKQSQCSQPSNVKLRAKMVAGLSSWCVRGGWWGSQVEASCNGTSIARHLCWSPNDGKQQGDLAAHKLLCVFFKLVLMPKALLTAVLMSHSFQKILSCSQKQQRNKLH